VQSTLRRWGPLAILGIGLAWYAFFLVTHAVVYAGGADSSGYLNSARLLGEGRLKADQRVWPGLSVRGFTPFCYVPLGFRPGDDGADSELCPTYPIGVPLLIAAASQIVGWDAGPATMILLHALAGVLLQFRLGRCAGLSFGAASLGALLLALCPLYVAFSLQLMSDVPATTWGLAAVVCAWQARRWAGWSVPAGAALAMAVLIRPTDVLVTLPALIALGVGGRRWLGFALGAAPGAILQLLYNRAVYGHFVDSGYGSVGGLFRWEYVPLSLASYRQWLPVLLTPFGMLALLVPVTARRSPRWCLLLSVWMLSFAGLYAFYFHTHETWAYLRFILPAFPAAWIAALLVAEDLADRSRIRAALPPGSVRAWIAGGLLVAALAVFDCNWCSKLWAARPGDRNYFDAVAWMRPQAPASSLVLCMQTSGAVYAYSDLTVLRWDQVGAGDLGRIDEAAEGRPIFAFLMSCEEEQAFREPVLVGRWNKVGEFRDFGLWRLEPGSAKRPFPSPPGLETESRPGG
jgi:hypothetical protein